MYDFSWKDIESVLYENDILIKYDDENPEKAIGIISNSEDNDFEFSLYGGKVSSIALKNARLNLFYRVSESEVHLDIIYGKRSATVITDSSSESND